MRAGDRHTNRLRVEPLEIRLLPTTLIPGADLSPGIAPGGGSTGLVSVVASAPAGSDSVDVIPLGPGGTSPRISALDADGDDPDEYGAPVDLMKTVSTDPRGVTSKTGSPSAEAHETSGRPGAEHEGYREDERAADSVRARPPALPANGTTLPTPHEAAGGHERRTHPSPPTASGGPEAADAPREGPARYAAGSPAAPPQEAPATPPAAAAAEGSRAGPATTTAPPPSPPPPESVEVVVGGETPPEAALAAAVPLDTAELEQAASDFLSHLARLASGSCDEDWSWEYVGLAAGVLLAGGLAHAALVMRARGRMRLIEFEVENGDGCPRYR
jgi:hypothetical protein